MSTTTQHQTCAIECMHECARLSHDFAYFVDHRDYEKFVALFVEDGTFERRGEVLRGRAGIMKAMQARPAELVTRHICSNIRIDLQADGTACGTGCLLLFHGSANGDTAGATPPHSVTVAEYSDVYVATPEGWRIRSRVTNIVF
jgi:hypothetical protein